MLGKDEMFLSDGTSMPEGTRRVEYGNGDAVYHVDSKGRTIHAEGVLDPPTTYEKEGLSSSIRPEGLQTGVDHRGHLVPERGAAHADNVNVQENVIAEHGTKSNLSTKKRWENQAIEYAKENPGSRSIHEPQYHGDEMRPHEVIHDLVGPDGNRVPGFRTTIANPRN
ncbi:DNA/RNA non-specific endonuclease [Cystobacter fuscus]|uniref:DNA/RNA non-specific endonuclease n=1 Tax=Cystobacter fuscus TaxID=43 RepID=UPI0012FDF82C|nr:DNA/RNA non-specific endonuclease [Cystobacter fuscus]